MALVSPHLQRDYAFLPISIQQTSQPRTVAQHRGWVRGSGWIKKECQEDYCRFPFPSVFGSREWDLALCEMPYQCQIHHDCSPSQDRSQDLPSPEEEAQRRGGGNGSLPSNTQVPGEFLLYILFATYLFLRVWKHLMSFFWIFLTWLSKDLYASSILSLSRNEKHSPSLESPSIFYPMFVYSFNKPSY